MTTTEHLARAVAKLASRCAHWRRLAIERSSEVLELDNHIRTLEAANAAAGAALRDRDENDRQEAADRADDESAMKAVNDGEIQARKLAERERDAAITDRDLALEQGKESARRLAEVLQGIQTTEATLRASDLHDFADELAALRTPKAPYAPQPADIIESNGRRFVRTGETRDPKAGEWFIGSNGIADEAFIDFDQWAFPILREIAPVGAA